MVNETPFKKSLVLVLNEGVDDKGKEIIKRYTYSNIKISATPQELLDAAQAIYSLINGTIEDFTTVETNTIY